MAKRTFAKSTGLIKLDYGVAPKKTELKTAKNKIYMLMHLTKVYPFCSIASCEGQDFRERCRSFGGNSLPTLPAGSTWRKADGRMDLCVRTVAAGSIG